jgi:hypothetical protein
MDGLSTARWATLSAVTVVRGVPALLHALVDDAGLFPPEQLAMSAALDRHRADERAGHLMLAHRFLCPASRLSELRGGLAVGDKLRLAVVADTGLAGLPAALEEAAADSRLTLEAVEIPLAMEADQPGAAEEALAALAEVSAAVYVEPQRGPGWLEAVEVIARSGRGAKVRCGGARAELFPSPEELASFIHACARAGVPFKASAGLHRAIRTRDERTGFVHHGYLNLALAACRAVPAGRVADLAAVLASTDARALAAQARVVRASTAAAARTLFVAYGSCSTSEPIEDVASLGLLESEGK